MCKRRNPYQGLVSRRADTWQAPGRHLANRACRLAAMPSLQVRDVERAKSREIRVSLGWVCNL